MTLSGLLDVSYGSVSGSATNKLTEVNPVGTSLGSATSNITFNAVEDLGGGMRAQAFYSIDPRGFVNSNSALTRHESYVGLSGGFGQIRLGSINTASLQVNGASAPLGTATGSGFTNIQTAAGGAVRFDSSVRYDTPNFNGFAASVTYATGNKDANAGGANQGATDIGLSYAKGPLAINFSSLKRTASDAQAAVAATCTALNTPVGCNTGTAAVAARVASTFNSIGANYTMGATRVFAGYGKGDDSSASVTAATAATSTATATTIGQDTKLTRFGASHTMGAVTLLGQYSTVEIGTGANNKRTATGFRADYALSKRTVAYAAYEAYDNGATTANKVNSAAVGVRHSF